MKKFLAFLMLSTVVLSSIGCDKDDDDNSVEPKVYEVEIMAPKTSDTFMSGESNVHVHVNFTAVNTDVIHNVGYRVLNKETGEEIEGLTYMEHAHIDGSGELHADLTIMVTDHSDLTLEVSAWNHDHDGPTTNLDIRDTDPDITTATVDFHVHPM